MNATKRNRVEITVSEKEQKAINRLYLESQESPHEPQKRDMNLVGNVMARLARVLIMNKQKDNQ